jgi:hypothetical protein
MKLIPIPYIPIVVLSILWNVSVFSLPKKIYFMELKSNEPKSAEEFRRGLKEIYAKDSNFELVDEDTIEDLNEKLKKQQMLGCDETRCLQEISNSFGAEEIITGELKVLANQYFLSLKVTKRDPDTFEVGIKSNLQKSFFEKQKVYYTKEITKYINNPAYNIDDRSAPPTGGSASYKKNLPFAEVISPTIPEFIKIPKDPPISKEEVLLLYIAKGDEQFKSLSYSEAGKIYQTALDYASSNKLKEPLDIALRLDLTTLLPLFNSYPSFAKREERNWSLTETEEVLLPTMEAYVLGLNQDIRSTNGKKIYNSLLDSTYASLGVLYAESLNLLYESNRLEEYITRFRKLDSSLNSRTLPTSPSLSFIQTAQAKESKRKTGIEKDYLPAWNDELKRNCLTIYVTARIFPYLQIETGDPYSSTLDYIRELSASTKRKLQSGKGAITSETEQVCRGVR